MEDIRVLRVVVVTLLVVVVTTPFAVYGYSVSTHENLHNNILSEYARIKGTTLSKDEASAFTKGAKLEDESPRWLQHFYDPVYDTGFKGRRPTPVVWATSPLMQGEFLKVRLFRDKTTRLLEHKGHYSWQRVMAQ